MKKLALILIVFMVLFNSCSDDCQDVSVGSVELMPSSLVLLNSLKGKTLIYKDSLDKTIVFKAESGITNIDQKVPTKVLCQEAFNFSVEFLSSKMNLLKLTSPDLNVELNLNVSITNKGLDTLTTDTLLYDIIECKVGNNSLSSIFFQLENSKRGTIKPDILANPKPIEELTILSKTFKQVNVRNNNLKVKNIEPLELYFNLNQGVVAIRLLDGRLFVLDKVE
jgi:hypothetical protein